MRRTLYWVAILLFVIMLIGWEPVRAQEEVPLVLTVDYEFGDHITFTARLDDPSMNIEGATIFIYDSMQSIVFTQSVEFDENGVSVYRFDMKENTIRPFTTILWRYELTFSDGKTLQSQSQTIRYDDDRFNWRSLETDGIHVYWYNGDDEFGASALNAALAGLQAIRKYFDPDISRSVDVFIYSSIEDLQGALYLAEDWVAGHADSPAGIAVVTIPPGADQGILMEQRIPHELMHIFLYRRIGAGYDNIPAWLREGFALLAEIYPNADYEAVLKDAYTRDHMIPIWELCDTFSPDIASAFLAYAESGSFTSYLREQYGVDGLLNLAEIYAGGTDCEHGTERAFGVSLSKLQRDWQSEYFGGNSILETLQDFLPYLALLCLVVFVPIIGIIGSMKRKGDPNG